MMDYDRTPAAQVGPGLLRRLFLAGVVVLALVAEVLPAQTTLPTAPSNTTQTASATEAPTIASLAGLQQMIERGHADAALEQLDRMAAGASVPAGVQRVRGLALYSQGKLLAAEQAFAAALLQDPADRLSTQMRGIALFRLGRPAAAIPLLEVAASLAQTQAPSQTQPELAQTSARQPNGPVDPQYVLALCYLDTRRFDDARHAFAAQYGFPGDSASAYLLAARMLLRREYLPVAQQFARKALELSPQLPLAHLLLGETELAGNHLDEAIVQFQQEKQVNPLDSAIYDRLGDAYIRRGDYDNARQSLQEAILLEPNFTGPFILLGKALLKQQDPAGASTYLEHARDMDPQNFMAHSLLGQAYRQMGRTDDARAETSVAERLQAAAGPKLEDVH